MCRYCGLRRACKPRILCEPCYYTPEIRASAPVDEKFGRRGTGLHNLTAPPLPPPTNYLPGTVEKLAVMEWRAENGYAVFHPADAVRE